MRLCVIKYKYEFSVAEAMPCCKRNSPELAEMVLVHKGICFITVSNVKAKK